MTLLNSLASLIESAVFPTAVGPAITTKYLFVKVLISVKIIALNFTTIIIQIRL